MPSTPSSAAPDEDAVRAEPSVPAGPTRRGRWILVGIAVALVAIVGVVTFVVVDSSGSSSGNSSSNSSSAKIVPKALSANVGDTAPDFSLETLDGRTVQLSDFRGTPVVLNFWASWCNPCRKEFPLLRETLAANPGTFTLLGVNTKDFVESDGRAFVKAQRATWPNGFDADEAVAKGYGVTDLPQTFFIDKDGVIRSHLYGGLTADALQQQLTKIGA